jgi:cell division protein FtsQ
MRSSSSVHSSFQTCRKARAGAEHRNVPARARFSFTVVRAEAVALPRRIRLPHVSVGESLARLAPTRRSLAVGLGMLAFAVAAYALARETSLFAVSQIEVQGASPRLAAQVRAALSPVTGTSLVGLDGAAAMRRVDALPTIVSASYDRAFPHTLRVRVVPERPAVVLRRGPDSWLVSARGRVIERLPLRADPKLPRVWVSGRTPVRIGATLVGGVGAAARAAALAGPIGRRVASATYANGLLVFHLRSGLEVLLGDPVDVRVKAAVAARALPSLPAGATYLDVSVPGRAVAGAGEPTAILLQGSGRG